VVAVNASSLANPSLEQIGSMPVCIARDANGIYAMTLTCTHVGCNIGQGVVALSGLQCPCHGSRFDANGTVQAGSPAQVSLQHFAVTADANGLLTIHTGTDADHAASDVSAETRLTGV
jgi:Rieske Fe-S protein